MKKEKLKKIVLGTSAYDTDIYRLLITPYLDDIIAKIDDTKVVSNVDPKEIISSEEQVVKLLNRFFVFFKQNYYHLYPNYAYVIQCVFENNDKEVYKYLSSKHYLGDGKYVKSYKDSFVRLSITNLVKNVKYIPEIKNLFKMKKIKIKDIKDYSYEEVIDIANILSDITYANDDFYFLIILFVDLSTVIEGSKSENERNARINHYRLKYQCMIEDYLKKEKYIKKIKDYGI